LIRAASRRPSSKARKRWRVCSGTDILFIRMLLGAAGATESPLSCFDSGRVHPNPFFQQVYAFTKGKCDVIEINTANSIKVFVLLAYNFSVENWNKDYKNGTLLGLNGPFAYGYHRAKEFGFDVEYSADKHETKIEKLLRLAVRYFLKFDFIHAMHNRKGLCKADVI
jgi:hypothetical protein